LEQYLRRYTIGKDEVEEVWNRDGDYVEGDKAGETNLVTGLLGEDNGFLQGSGSKNGEQVTLLAR
jgi:hypothetical protein